MKNNHHHEIMTGVFMLLALICTLFITVQTASRQGMIATKGYDLYAKSITKILNEFPKWKAFSVGDEDRRKIFINHKNHYELGFLSHKKVLDLLDKTSISVVPSKWEEPFGRTALESTSRGCATIISNRGGLPETTGEAIILKNLDTNNLYRSIRYLIKNRKERNLLP